MNMVSFLLHHNCMEQTDKIQMLFPKYNKAFKYKKTNNTKNVVYMPLDSSVVLESFNLSF